uniref:non-homologous end-joining DNA ligase LigD n=1 Tax=Nonomuraea pusilla TaxID=46177 RepID=UPI00350E519E
MALTNLGQPLFDGAGATKRDLVDYLDAVRDRILPALRGRPLSVVRVRPGQEPFMQKNLPSYAPSWIRRVGMWAEASRRQVSYALCDDRRTLLWFANQRSYFPYTHSTLATAPREPVSFVGRAIRHLPARRLTVFGCPAHASVCGTPDTPDTGPVRDTPHDSHGHSGRNDRRTPCAKARCTMRGSRRAATRHTPWGELGSTCLGRVLVCQVRALRGHEPS